MPTKKHHRGLFVGSSRRGAVEGECIILCASLEETFYLIQHGGPLFFTDRFRECYGDAEEGMAESPLPKMPVKLP